ncbi:MAG: hypothetical protein JWN17_1263 [Frankiales bacterium]|nr:hypothetical protein [Frankiales bacterium]
MTAPALADVPVRADGVELLGDLVGSGYRETPALVRRGDGQTLQLTPLLAHLLDLVDGRRDHELLAAQLSERVGRQASADDVRTLLAKLDGLGLLRGADGTQPVAAPRANPLLALRLKVVVSDPAVTRRLTGPFTWLFRTWVVVPVLLAFAATSWWVLVDKGLAGATRSAFYDPGLLLLVFALTVLSAGFHEFGHAAACRYGGATPGAMGAGLYLVWPAFYTNVDDSYRLSRWGRLRVDLGGLYFNALVAVAVTGAFLVTHRDALLLGVATQLLQMLRQLAPVIRADGYHVLADLTGVPDLFAHLGPTVKALVPWRKSPPSALKPWARVVVSAWVLVVVPVLLATTLGGVLMFPRLVATAWDSGGGQASALLHALGTGDVLTAAARLLSLVALVLPVLAVGYLVVRIARRLATSAWSVTDGRPRARVALLVVTALLLGLAAWAWSPGSGRYVPVQQGERGTLPGVSRLVTRPVAQQQVALPGRTGRPQLAMALVPHDRRSGAPVLLLSRDQQGATRALLASGDGRQVAARSLPFALPDAPGQDDNQALAVGTTDGATTYDAAYALVWVEDGKPVTSRNEAYALASCRRCTTVAVAFQVVLVVGQSDAQVPVNAAVAANGGCVECVTRALAVQLVATLKAAPTDDVRRQLEKAFGAVRGLDPSLGVKSLYAQLQAVQASVVQVLVGAGLVDPEDFARPSAAPTASAASSGDPSAAPSGTPDATPSGQADATAAPSEEATSPATEEPTADPTEEAASTAAPEQTPAAAAEPTVAPSP